MSRPFYLGYDPETHSIEFILTPFHLQHMKDGSLNILLQSRITKYQFSTLKKMTIHFPKRSLQWCKESNVVYDTWSIPEYVIPRLLNELCGFIQNGVKVTIQTYIEDN